MKTRTKRIISSLAICAALFIEAGAATFKSIGNGLSSARKVDAANASVGTVLWGENFAHFGSKTAQDAGTGTGTTIFDGASIIYSCDTTSTGYNEKLAGGTAPEFLLKSGKTLTVSGIKTGGATEMTLTYLSNNTKSSVSCSTSQYEISGSSKSYTLKLKSGQTVPQTLTLAFGCSGNTRLDNIELKVSKVGGGSDTSTYSVNYLANTTDSVTGLPSAETGLSAGSHNLSTAKPTRNGYDFVGWNTDPSASIGITSVTIGTSDVDVYAIWKQQGGGGGDTSGYTLITDASNLIEGTTFILLHATDNSIAVGAWNTNKWDTAAASVSGNTASSSGAMVFTLGGSSGSWSLSDGTNYYGLQNSTTALRSTSASGDNYSWTISISNSGIATMKTAGSSTRSLCYNYNNGSDRFSAYVASDTYKEVRMFANIPSTKTVESIAVKTPPTKITTYYEGDTFDPAGLVITATYDDKSTADIAYAGHENDFSFNPSLTTALATTDKSVTITYKEKTATQSITVNSDTLNSISLSGSVTAIRNHAWDLSGVVVTGSFTSGNKTITGATLTPSSEKPTEYGSQNVTISASYGGKQASHDFTVDVVRTGTTEDDPLLASQAMTKSDGSSYYVEGVVAKVSGSYSSSFGNKNVYVTDDGSYTEDKSCFEFYRLFWIDGEKMTQEQYDSIVVGSKIVAYGKIKTYSGQKEFDEGCKLVSLVNKEVSSIAVTTNPSNAQFSGKAFDKTGMVVTASYSAGDPANVTNSVVIEPATLASNTTSVTIKYTEEGKTVQTTLAVDVLTLSNITVEGQTTSFRAGETFAFDGSVYPLYTHSNGNPESKGSALSSTDYEVSKSGVLAKGDNQEVTVSYGGKECKYNINVGFAYVTGITLSTEEFEMSSDSDPFTLTATVLPEETANPNYTVTVDSVTGGLVEGTDYSFTSGVLTILEGNKDGKITLKATSEDVKSDNTSHAFGTCVVTVSSTPIPQLTGFTVSGTAEKAKQYRNDTYSVDLTGLTITGVYDIDTTPDTFDADDFDWNYDGTYPVGTYKLNTNLTLTLDGENADGTTYTGITLENDGLDSIAFADNAALGKTSYLVGESWDGSDLAIVGIMKSRDTDDSLTATYTYSPEQPEYGITSVTVTAHYGSDPEYTVSKTFSGITVDKITKIEITSNPSKTDYIIGEEFDEDGLVVKATYSNGSTDTNFKGYTLDDSAVDMYAAGTYSVKIQAEGVSDATFNVKYGVLTPQQGIDRWDLVTSTAELEDGAEYLMVGYVNSSETYYVNGTKTGTNKFLNAIETTVENNSIASAPSDAAPIKLVKNNSNWQLMIGNNYLNTSSQDFAFSGDSGDTYTISISNNSASIESTDSGDAQVYFNSSSPRFKPYNNAQASLSLYKHIVQEAITADLIKLNASIVKDDQGVEKTFKEGETFKITDLTVNGLYNDGKEKAITSGVTFAESETSMVLGGGDNEVTIYYTVGEKTFEETITVYATPNTYGVSLDTDSAKVAEIDFEEVEKGETMTITVSPKDGYYFDFENGNNPFTLVDGNKQPVAFTMTHDDGVATITVENVQGNLTLSAEVEVEPIEINLDLSGIDSKSIQVVDAPEDPIYYGQNVSVGLANNDNFSGMDVKVKMGDVDITNTDSVQILDGVVTVFGVTGNLKISAIAKQVQYTAIPGDYTTVAGGEATGWANYKGAFQLYFIPEEGYKITGVTYQIDGGSEVTVDDYDPFKLTSVDGVLTMTPVVEPIEYTITGDQTHNGMVKYTFDKDGPYYYGDEVTVTFEVKEGYEVLDDKYSYFEIGGARTNFTECGATSVTITITGNAVICPAVEAIQHFIEITGENHEFATFNNVEQALYWKELTITFTPNQYKQIVGGTATITMGGTDISEDAWSYDTETGVGTVTVTVKGDVIIDIDFEAITTEVEITDVIDDGLIDYSGVSGEADLGEQFTGKIEYDETVYGTSSDDFIIKVGEVDITENCTVTIADGEINFKIPKGLITDEVAITTGLELHVHEASLDSDDYHVTISGNPKLEYTSKEEVTVTIKAEDHWIIDKLTISATGLNISEYKISNSEWQVVIHKGSVNDMVIKVTEHHEDVSVGIDKVEHMDLIFITDVKNLLPYETEVTGGFSNVELGYNLPKTIQVYEYGELLTASAYTYDKDKDIVTVTEEHDYLYVWETGEFTIIARGNILIRAAANEGTFSFTYSGSNATLTGISGGEVENGATIDCNVAANEGYRITGVTVTMGGDTLDRAYDEATGNIYIYKVTANVTVTVTTTRIVSITANVSNAELSNKATSVDAGASFESTITIPEGYELGEGAVRVTQIVDGVPDDITESAYVDGEISIDEVNYEIVIDVIATKIAYSVSTDLTNVEIDNDAASVEYGDSYVAVISLKSGMENLTASYTMGGGDPVTCNNGIIMIQKVTGDIKITASADEKGFSVSSSSTNATIEGDDDGDYKYSETYEATVSFPEDGYENESVIVYVNGVDMTNTYYNDVTGVISITGVSGEVSIVASSEAKAQEIEIEIENVNIPGLPQSIKYGDSIDVVVEPNKGYKVVSVVVYENGSIKPEYVIYHQPTKAVGSEGWYEIVIPKVVGDIKIEVESAAIKYDVDVTGLTHVVSNGAEVAAHDGSYVAKLSCAEGYENLHDIHVYMYDGDTRNDITATAVNENYIFIGKVTGAIEITASADAKEFDVSYDLDESVECNVDIETVYYDGTFSATITPAEGYFNVSVTVTMGGSPVAVEGGVISISKVTGKIEISASATKIELASITVTPETMEVEFDSELSNDDFVVTGHYNDGSQAVLDSDKFSIVGYDKHSARTQTVTIKVNDDIKTTVEVTVKASEVISGIEASTEKTEVEYGGSFTKEDVSASYVYTDGHKSDAIVDSISGFDANKLGEQTITVKVGDYTDTITIRITNTGRVTLSIDIVDYTSEVNQGKDYVFDGKVIAHYNDETSEEVTGYVVSKLDTSGHGKQTLTISFDGVSASVSINVIQTHTEIEPAGLVAIIGGAVFGVSVVAAGIFLFIKSFKLK